MTILRRFRLRIAFGVLLAVGTLVARAQEVVATVPYIGQAFGIAVSSRTNTIYCTGGGLAISGCTIINGADDSHIQGLTIVGDVTDGIAINPVNQMLYTANAGVDTGVYTVSLINGNTNTEYDEVVVPNVPYTVAVNSATNKAYAGCNGGNVSVIDGTLQVLVTTLKVADYVNDVAVDSTRNLVYAVTQTTSQNALTVIDGSTDQVMATVPISGDFALAVNPVTNHLYVSNRENDQVLVLDGGANFAVLATIHVGTEPVAIAVNTATNMVYVANESGNSVSVIDGSSNAVTATLPVAAQPTAIAVNEATNLVYASSVATGSLTVIDAVPVLPATITLGALNQTFDNTPKGPTATTSPAGLAYTLTVDGFPQLVYGPGTYAVAATITDPRYAGSANGTLSIAPGALPMFSVQPSPQTVSVGQSVTFTASATSPVPEYYVWYYGDQAIIGANASSYTIPDVQTSNAGSYSVEVYSSVGHVFSTSVTLTVNPPIAPPAVTLQPLSQTVATGASGVFWVGFSGYPTPTFQWSLNGAIVPGATHPVLAALAAGSYTVTVTNAGGTVTSSPAVLTIDASLTGLAPSISGQPVPQTVAQGSTVVFSVGIDEGTTSTPLASALGPRLALSSAPAGTRGASSTTYQWFQNGQPLAGGRASTLVIAATTPANAGTYSCVVGNAEGSVVTAPAGLGVVSTHDPGRLVNLSCRAQVGTGPGILITGFVVGGAHSTDTLPLLIRASGPALASFGVGGTLPDPDLDLFRLGSMTSAPFDSDEGWAGSAPIAAAAEAAGAFAWTVPASHDSALVEALAPGGYTAQVSGQSGDTGLALAEVYDTSPAPTPTSPRLVNLSARVSAGSGANVLIAGFVVGGSTSRTVLIRASGPALVPFGVTGTLADPQLQLFRSGSGGSSTRLAANQAWSGDANLAAAAGDVGAFSWPDPASKDSALLITLPPGAYTAQVAGATGDTGVALIEVYDVP